MSTSFAAELRKLRLAPDFISEEQADQILRFVNTYIADATGAHLIDVLWRQHAQQGAVILRPMSPGCINRTVRPQTLPYVVDRTGAWTPAYRTGRPLLFTHIHTSKTDSIIDQLSGENFSRGTLDIFAATDMLFVQPLTVETVVCGLFSIEWNNSFDLPDQLRTLIDAAAETCAMVCWKSEITILNHSQTAEAINIFIDAIQHSDAPHELEPTRTGFIARPYEDEFAFVESIINQHLARYGAAARSFSPVPGSGVVVPDILAAIARAHFAMVDITGQSPNVMLELGAVMATDTPFVIFRHERDKSVLPFDVASHHCYYYRREADSVVVLTANNMAPESLEGFLERFMAPLLKASTAFREAQQVKTAGQ
jgi:hypothetical protein